ncbi:MAG: hypothetical protein PGN34_04220 [Methylobacterium frigidaeris]
MTRRPRPSARFRVVLAGLVAALGASAAAAEPAGGRLDLARRHATEGRAALARGDDAAALAAFDAALAVIGEGAVPPGTIDDSGLHLVLADAKLRRGEMAAAARLKAGVVETRLSFLTRRNH